MSVSQLRGYAGPYGEILRKAKGLGLSPRRLLIGAAAGLLLIVAALYADYWWTTGRFLVSTDDAYVRAHSVLISPKVPGYIAEVSVDDNQAVKAGQVLARIDPRDYQTALDQARANVAAAQANIDTLNQQIHQQRLAVAQARQQVTADQAATVYAQQNFERYTELARTGYGPVQTAQQATADIRQRQAALQRDSTAVDAAMAQVRVFKAQRAQAKATLAQLSAAEVVHATDTTGMVIPLRERIEAVGDDADLEELYNTERHLPYAVCTRARDHLLVTGVKPASEFLDDLNERNEDLGFCSPEAVATYCQC